jgi:hypothetical protein
MPKSGAQVAIGLLAAFLALACDFNGARKARDPFQVFSREQWRNLAAVETQAGAPFGRVRPEAFGLVDKPGFIPLDLDLLKRVTFVGTPMARLDGLLGPNGRAWIPNQPFGETRYEMFPDPDRCYRVLLELKFEANDDFVPVVVAEKLDRFSQCVS